MADWIKYNPTSNLWELSTDDGGSFNTLDIDAAQITSGAFAKARQNAQTPYKDEANTFSQIQTFSAIPLLSGGGIKFPSTQIPSSDANTLDDYEEGDWTPTIGGDTGETGQVYSSTRIGKYIKVGGWCWVYCNVALTNKGTISGGIRIKGLPFNMKNTPLNQAPAVMISYWITATAYVSMGGFISGATPDKFILLALTAAGNMTSGLVDANIANNSQFVISCFYQVD